MTIKFDADWISKLLTFLLAIAGGAQWMDWVNFFAFLSPENAAGAIGAINAVKLAVNAWTKATTVTVPKAPL